MADLESALLRARHEVLRTALELTVNHADMLDKVATELERTFGRDFGLRHPVALLAASVEDMRAAL